MDVMTAKQVRDHFNALKDDVAVARRKQKDAEKSEEAAKKEAAEARKELEALQVRLSQTELHGSTQRSRIQELESQVSDARGNLKRRNEEIEEIKADKAKEIGGFVAKFDKLSRELAKRRDLLERLKALQSLDVDMSEASQQHGVGTPNGPDDHSDPNSASGSTFNGSGSASDGASASPAMRYGSDSPRDAKKVIDFNGEGGAGEMGESAVGDFLAQAGTSKARWEEIIVTMSYVNSRLDDVIHLHLKQSCPEAFDAYFDPEKGEGGRTYAEWYNAAVAFKEEIVDVIVPPNQGVPADGDEEMEAAASDGGEAPPAGSGGKADSVMSDSRQ